VAVPVRASTPASGVTESEGVGGLTMPTAMAFLPDGRLLVTQLGGELLLVDRGSVKALFTIPVSAEPAGGVGLGLRGRAGRPQFPGKGRVYLYRRVARAGSCEPPLNRVNELICVELVNDAVDPATLVVLVSGIRTDTGDHNGGGVRVGPDRKLYVGVGDTGRGDMDSGGNDDLPPGMSTNPYAQNLG